jgi:hypothetical protein
MAANTSAWDSHQWLTRQVELAAGIHADQYTCHTCGRHFIIEKPSEITYAVHIGLHRFDRLPDEVTARWFEEFCPQQTVASDIEDLQTRYSR